MVILLSFCKVEHPDIIPFQAFFYLNSEHRHNILCVFVSIIPHIPLTIIFFLYGARPPYPVGYSRIGSVPINWRHRHCRRDKSRGIPANHGSVPIFHLSWRSDWALLIRRTRSVVTVLFHYTLTTGVLTRFDFRIWHLNDLWWPLCFLLP